MGGAAKIGGGKRVETFQSADPTACVIDISPSPTPTD